jgi:hypothetical protein
MPWCRAAAALAKELAAGALGTSNATGASRSAAR